MVSVPSRSAFAGFRFSLDVIVLAVRRYLRFGLSYLEVEELLAERGIEVDHVTITAGYGASRRCLSTRPGSPGIGSGTVGTGTRRL
jgi:hypothetical protein